MRVRCQFLALLAGILSGVSLTPKALAETMSSATANTVLTIESATFASGGSARKTYDFFIWGEGGGAGGDWCPDPIEEGTGTASAEWNFSSFTDFLSFGVPFVTQNLMTSASAKFPAPSLGTAHVGLMGGAVFDNHSSETITFACELAYDYIVSASSSAQGEYATTDFGISVIYSWSYQPVTIFHDTAHVISGSKVDSGIFSFDVVLLPGASVDLNIEASISSSANAEVPEPSSLALLVIGGIGLLGLQTACVGGKRSTRG